MKLAPKKMEKGIFFQNHSWRHTSKCKDILYIFPQITQFFDIAKNLK